MHIMMNPVWSERLADVTWLSFKRGIPFFGRPAVHTALMHGEKTKVRSGDTKRRRLRNPTTLCLSLVMTMIIR
jgi:hypothetical protein